MYFRHILCIQKNKNMSCIICGSLKTKELFRVPNVHGRHLISIEEHFLIAQCVDCKIVFPVDVKINSDYYKKYYEIGYYDDKISSKFSFWALDILANFSTKRKQKLAESYLKNPNDPVRILDVGCGSGNFLLRLDSKRFIKYGAEVNAEAVGLCESNGLAMYNQNVLDIDFTDTKFDVITMWHVLEHIHNPIETLKKIYTLLPADGLFIFQIPNSGSWGFKYGQANWFHLDSPRHLALYGIPGVEKLCELSGFKIVQIKNEFYDYPLDLFWSVRKSPIRYIMYPFYLIAKCFSKETLTFVCKKI